MADVREDTVDGKKTAHVMNMTLSDVVAVCTGLRHLDTSEWDSGETKDKVEASRVSILEALEKIVSGED